MKKLIVTTLAAACMFAADANANVEVGKPAPDFTAPAASGKTVKLSDYKGNIVVLEWTNPGCPFVHKFYDSDVMQGFQKEAVKKGIIWLSVNSSAMGNEGFVDAEGANKFIKDKAASPSEYLLDSKGVVGHLYGAKTTPHMFVIDKAGMLAYMGAMDDKPSPYADDLKNAKNYVNEAIDALLAGKKLVMPSTQSYGCSVKY